MSKTKMVEVEGICSWCGQSVGFTDKDIAYRHGFKRHKTKMIGGRKKFSQEDSTACQGSGQRVTLRRYNK